MKIQTVLFCVLPSLVAADTGVGLFDSHQDVGVNPKTGSAEFRPATGEYRITGGGANIWAATDAFQFAWKKMSHDVAITADIRFEGTGVNAHRKAALMIRQSLDPGSAYADVAVHGDGLTSLQFRPSAGAATQESRSELKGPVRVRIERRGSQFRLLAGTPGSTLQPTGPVTVEMSGDVYVGLAVCSHDAQVLETAVFTNVKVEELLPPRPPAKSLITIYDLKTRKSTVVYTSDKIFEAPNWSPDGRFLLVNSGGNLYRLPLDSKSPEPQKIELGELTRCNNDHGIAPDGKTLAISSSAVGRGSQVYLANADGSGAHLMTEKWPSYYHGWSPDGKWLAYTAQRGDNFDIYRVAVTGGEEERLTSSPGYDDGPDYSRDGKWIYVNSDRTGHFQVWRFPADGAGPSDEKAQQVTRDTGEIWFPHPSPDGKWMTVISFPHGTLGHPPNRNVELRLAKMPGDKLKDLKFTTVVKLFGGQGTINVNSWSPDSRKFAYVSYELIPK